MKLFTILSKIRSRLIYLINPLDSSWIDFVNNLSIDILTYNARLSKNEKQELFKKYVKVVEFEPHAFCNRVCSFCPNSFIDRVSNRQVFDIELFNKIIDQLAYINYSGKILFSRYCESLALDSIFDYINIVKKKLPYATLDIISNGDYLTRELLDKLIENHVDTLRISIYPNNDKNWNKDTAFKLVHNLAEKIKLEADLKYSGSDIIQWVIPHKEIDIYIETKNLFQIGFCRGASLKEFSEKKYTRFSPCKFVFDHFTIDYNGSVMPCCNLRSDYQRHKNFIIEDMSKSDFVDVYDIYMNKTFSEWRKRLYDCSEKSFPCNSCSQKAVNNKRSLKLLSKKINKLHLGNFTDSSK